MKALATLGLAVGAVAGLLALGTGPSVELVAALAVALPVAGASLRRLRRRDPHDFDVIVAVAGGLAAVAYGGLALNGARGNAGALAVAGVAAAATVAALVDLALLVRRPGPVPDLLAARFPSRDLVETDGVQWALAAPQPGLAGAVEVAVGLQNAWDARREVTVRLDLPAGWSAPAALGVVLGPLEAGVLHVPLAAAPGARRGKGRAWLAVRGDAGRRVRHRRRREIPPPPSGAGKALGLLLALRNPFELLLALAEPAVRFRLAPGPDVGAGAAGPPRPARWEPGAPVAAPTRAAQAAARLRGR